MHTSNSKREKSEGLACLGGINFLLKAAASLETLDALGYSILKQRIVYWADGMVPRELVRGGAPAAARGAVQVPRGGVPPPRCRGRRHRHATYAQLHQEGRLHFRHRHWYE